MIHPMWLPAEKWLGSCFLITSVKGFLFVFREKCTPFYWLEITILEKSVTGRKKHRILSVFKCILIRFFYIQYEFIA